MNWLTRIFSGSTKTLNPLNISSWLGSVLNGTAERSNVDLVLTATANRCVTRISTDLASVPLVIEVQKGKKWERVEPAPRGAKGAPFGDVAGVFERANPQEGKTSLWTRFHASMEWDGKAVLFTDYQNNGQPPRGKAPRELRFLLPSQVTPNFPNGRSAFSEPLSYRYGGIGSSVLLRPDEVLYHVFPDPRDPSFGAALAPADSVRVFGVLEDELSEYTLDYFRNGARGSLAFETEQTPSDEQRAQLEAEINRSNVGKGKRFKFFLATHGLKIKELNGRKETDFADLYGIITEKVSMGFGVPPAFLADYGDSGIRANLEEQTPIYVEGTLMPKGALLEQNLTEIVLPRFDVNGTLRARFDWDAHPMVQRMRRSVIFSLGSAVGGPFLTPNDARAAASGRMPDLEPLLGGDLTYAVGANPVGIGPTARPKSGHMTTKSGRKWIDDPVRHAKRVASGVSLDRYEKPAEKLVRQFFTQQEARALHAFEKSGKALLSARSGQRRKADDDGFDDWDEEYEVEQTTHLIARIYAQIASQRGPEAAAEVGGNTGDFLLTDPAVREFLDKHAYENGKRITGTTAEFLRETLLQGHEDGETVDEMTRRIRDVFGLRRDQAAVIARTETVRAYNFSTVEGYKASGLVEEIEWLATSDDRTRDTHADYDGEVRALGEEFAPGLKFPGDPDCEDPAEVCNCRCTILPRNSDTEAFRVSPGAFEKLFKNRLTNGKTFTDKAAV